MIIYVPRGKGNGGRSPRTVEMLDIYPTLADLCGIEPPKAFAGRSLKPLLQNPKAKWGKAALTQVSNNDRNGRCVRTERWRYTEWDGGNAGAELYDHRKDPQELKNLAKDPHVNSVIEELKPFVRKR